MSHNIHKSVNDNRRPVNQANLKKSQKNIDKVRQTLADLAAKDK